MKNLIVEVPQAPVTVLELGGDKEQTFTCTAREAVICAHAQSFGDMSTWNYAKNYDGQVKETRHGWTCGRFWARDPNKPAKEDLENRIVKSSQFDEHMCMEDKRLTAPFSKRIPLSTYDVNEEGYIRNESGRTFYQVLKELNTALMKMPWPEDQDGAGDYGGFSFCEDYGKSKGTRDATWPTEWQWIAVFPVNGSSEGHYVHVEIIHRNGSRQLVYLFKTFAGREHASLVATRVAALLGA